MPEASLPLGVTSAVDDRIPEVLDSRKRSCSKIVAPACPGAVLDGCQFSGAREGFFSRFRLGRKQQIMDFTGYRFLIIGHLKIPAVASASLQRCEVRNDSSAPAG